MIEVPLQPYLTKLKLLFGNYIMEQKSITLSGNSAYYSYFAEWLYNTHNIKVRFGTRIKQGGFMFETESEKTLFLLKWG